MRLQGILFFFFLWRQLTCILKMNRRLEFEITPLDLIFMAKTFDF
jgi:hypothetical protein